MRQLVRTLGIVGRAGIVAAGRTTGQSSSGGIGETASDTIRDHPQTAAGAGVGAAGGAVVGGLAGGTKGAVVGGLLGALAGGAIGNYIERREASLPQTSSTSPRISRIHESGAVKTLSTLDRTDLTGSGQPARQFRRKDPSAKPPKKPYDTLESAHELGN